MTLFEAAKQALEALESSRVFVTTREKIKHPEGTEWYDERITALRTAIAEAESVEPVAWICEGMSSDEKHSIDYGQEDVDALPIGTMLYTTPPAAQPAPDLLNALKRIVDEPNNTMSDGKALKEIIRIARAAIAKATGTQT